MVPFGAVHMTTAATCAPGLYLLVSVGFRFLLISFLHKGLSEPFQTAGSHTSIHCVIYFFTDKYLVSLVSLSSLRAAVYQYKTLFCNTMHGDRENIAAWLFSKVLLPAVTFNCVCV